MITRKHKITLILVGQILLLLALIQYGVVWWHLLIAALCAALPWWMGLEPQESLKVATDPATEFSLSKEHTQVLSQLEEVLQENIQRISEPLAKQLQIVNTSAETINHSFFSLQRVSEEQAMISTQLVDNLLANQGSEFDLMQVLPKTDAIIQKFVQILVDISEKSISAVHSIHDMS
ncbi:MAG: methyl-accepting chemotaxis protein, partial [Vibrio sp.]